MLSSSTQERCSPSSARTCWTTPRHHRHRRPGPACRRWRRAAPRPPPARPPPALEAVRRALSTRARAQHGRAPRRRGVGRHHARRRVGERDLLGEERERRVHLGEVERGGHHRSHRQLLGPDGVAAQHLGQRRRRRTGRRCLGQRATDHGGHVVRHVGDQLGEVRRRAVHVGQGHLRGRGAGERASPADRLEQHRAEGVDVGRGTSDLAPHALGCEVGGRSDHVPGRRQRLPQAGRRCRSRRSLAPGAVSITFEGFTSRCTMPVACRAASPSATCAATSAAAATSIGPEASRWAQGLARRAAPSPGTARRRRWP